VREKIRAIPNFPAPLAMLVEHLILSHHGSYEFGSPSLPQIREAVALHFLDDMDSKMGAMRATLESPEGNDDWTARNPSLRRSLLRADKFYSNGEQSGASSQASATSGHQNSPSPQITFGGFISPPASNKKDDERS
jgi:3'-5' exoribonuclease